MRKGNCRRTCLEADGLDLVVVLLDHRIGVDGVVAGLARLEVLVAVAMVSLGGGGVRVTCGASGVSCTLRLG